MTSLLRGMLQLMRQCGGVKERLTFAWGGSTSQFTGWYAQARFVSSDSGDSGDSGVVRETTTIIYCSSQTQSTRSKIYEYAWGRSRCSVMWR